MFLGKAERKLCYKCLSIVDGALILEAKRKAKKLGKKKS